MKKNDQYAYINIVKKIHDKNFWYLGDRARTPLYPYIQAIFYKPSMSEEVLFKQGKILNIVLSLFCIGTIYVVISKYLSHYSRNTFILITFFSFFLLKAAYFQTEILFYTLNFLVFLWSLKALSKENYKVSMALGLLSALSYLAKASAILGIVVFVFTKLVIIILNFIKNKKYNLLKKSVLNVSLTILVFFTILSPYLVENKIVYGKFFYNVVTDFYIWYDSWDEVEKGTRAHGDREGWPEMPDNQIPSLKKYLREHTITQLFQREIKGLMIMIVIATATYTSIPFSYILLFMLFIIPLPMENKKALLVTIRKRVIYSLFVVLYLLLTILATAWQLASFSEVRFMYPLFLPTMFVIFYLTQKAWNNSLRIRFNHLNLLYIVIFLLQLPLIIFTSFNIYTGV